jgi:hypothetical protein
LARPAIDDIADVETFVSSSAAQRRNVRNSHW